MLRRLTFLIPLFTALIASSGFAKELTLEEVKAMQSKVKGADTLAVDFVQTTQTRMAADRGKKPRSRDGKAVFAKPDKFKWMLETPTQEYKLYDGKDFFDYDPASQSAVKYSPTGPRAHDIRQVVDLVLNIDTLLKRYDLVKAEESEGVARIELKPKAASDVTGIELHMAAKDGFISYLKLEMANKTVLAHTFKNPTHPALGADAFALPKSVKVTEGN